MLVAGEAGVGKTAAGAGVLRAAAAAPDAAGAPATTSFTPRPLGPFLDAAGGRGGALAPARWRRAPAAHEVASALLRAGRRRPSTVVVLEDLHWADEATLDVAAALARRIAGRRLLVVATYRDDELERTHPLRVVLGELAARAGRARWRPAAVGRRRSAELAAPAGVDAAELHRQTSGNPFFVTEVLAAGERRDPAHGRAPRCSAGPRG